jgi:Zn-dependent protease
VFNFLPVAPLDGFAVAVGLLPRDLSLTVARWEQYGPGILMLLLVLPYLTGYSLLSDIMSPILNVLTRVIVGGGAVF